MASRPAKLSQAPIELAVASGRADVLGDVLSLGLLRNALYQQMEARAPWGLDVKARNRAMLYLIARGQARLEVEGLPPLVLAAGDVAFLPRGAAHVIRDSASTRPSAVCDSARQRPTAGPRRIGGRGAVTSIVAAFFDFDRAPPPLLGRPADVLVLPGEGAARDPLASATIALVLAELESPGPASVLLLQRLADVLVVQAMRSMSKLRGCVAQRESRPQGLVALADPHVHKALSLLHAQVERAWTVGELAARVGLSRSGLAARFTDLVGEPPLQYLARWRMARAAEILRDTDEAVSAIAERVGYESVPSFNKAFKRWQGESPVAYRRAARSIVTAVKVTTTTTSQRTASSGRERTSKAATRTAGIPPTVRPMAARGA